MRRIFFALLLATLWGAASAQAATTFTSGDCNAGITITGGLTLAQNGSPANGIYWCRANVTKWSGLWYFESTGTSITNNTAIGVSAPSTVVGATDATATQASLAPGGDIFSAAGLQDGKHYWAGVPTAGSVAWATGKTAGYYVNLDTDPPQAWYTPDVASLICDGSGGSGSTAPQFNGSCANDPTLLGTAGNGPGGTWDPNDGSGHVNGGPFLPGYQYQPVFAGTKFGGGNIPTVVFNFGGSAFVGTPRPGYSSWDTAGGTTAPNPGPTNPQTINVANAPGWTATTGYVVGNRVTAGPGWNGSAYTSGSKLCLFAVAASGGGTSGSSASAFNTACNSGTPAGVGGIPTGSWGGATTVTDGSVTWVLLTVVDYVTLTGAFDDGDEDWTAGHTYWGAQFVYQNGNSYELYPSFASQPFYCVAGGSFSPTFVWANNTDYSDGGCTNWQSQAPITYTSKANRWPHQKSKGVSGSAWQLQFNWLITIKVWYGGSNRPLYQTNENGEAPVIQAWRHYDLINDIHLDCMRGASIGVAPVVDSFRCLGNLVTPYWHFTVPAGDSFVDHTDPATDPVGQWDSAKGVTLLSTQLFPMVQNVPWAGVGSGPTEYSWQTVGEPVAWSDSIGVIDRVQMVSTSGMAFAAHAMISPGDQKTDNILLDQYIIDSATGPAAEACDGGCKNSNGVVISRTPFDGADGIQLSYPGYIYNNTIVGLSTTTAGAPYSVANTIGSFANLFSNNYAYGFRSCFSVGVSQLYYTEGNSATDLSSCPTSTYFNSLLQVNVTETALQNSGNVTSAAPSSNVMQPVIKKALTVQDSSVGGGFCTCTTQTLTIPAHTGDLILAASVAAVNVLSIADDKGSSWLLRTQNNLGTSPLEEWYAKAPSDGTYTVTITWTGTTSFWGLTLLTIPGTPGSSFFDANGSLPAKGTTSLPSFSTTASDALVLMFCSCNSATPPPATSGWFAPSLGGFTVTEAKRYISPQSSVTPIVDSGATPAESIIDAVVIDSSSPIDLRVKNSSANIYGAGAAFSENLVYNFYGTLSNPTDIIGTSRSGLGRYDIGAQECTVCSSPPPSAGGGRRLLR